MSAGEPVRRQDSSPLGQEFPQRVTLYIRDNVPAALTDTIQWYLDRLARLEEAGSIAAYRVEQWPPCTTGPEKINSDGHSRQELVATFEKWATEHGCSLEPAFEMKTVTSSLSDRNIRAEQISVPLLTLVLYENGDINGIAPCSHGDQTYTVENCITALETDGLDVFPQAPLEQGRRTTPGGQD